MKLQQNNEGRGVPALTAEKRVILSMGGKGGVGKTCLMTALTEWFDAKEIPAQLLDLDSENKARGAVILADMGADSGQVTYDWFDRMYPDVAEAGIAFTAIGVVTSDPASVESVLAWAARLQKRTQYLIVENSVAQYTDFRYWRESTETIEFQRIFQPAVITMDYRLPELENAARNHGVTLASIADRATSAPELQKASLVMRAQSYRRRMFAEFDRVKELLLP
jgi:MinD-like ATPase involved in chromosome partitioning or flagellar assembly